MVLEPEVNQDRPETVVHQESPVLLEDQDLQDHREIKEAEDLLVLQVIRDYKGDQGRQDHKVLQGNLDLWDHLDQRV